MEPDSAYMAAAMFHNSHRERIFDDGRPKMNQWEKNLLADLQTCLYTMSKKLDETTAQVARLEFQLARVNSMLQQRR